MHENFLTSSENYSQCKEFWKRLCADAIAMHSNATGWTPWLCIHLEESDTVPLEENVYSLYSGELNRAITIQQYAAAQDRAWAIFARTGRFGIDVLDVPIDYLLIGCVLDEEIAHLASTLIAEWTNPKSNIEQMDALIERTLNL